MIQSQPSVLVPSLEKKEKGNEAQMMLNNFNGLLDPDMKCSGLDHQTRSHNIEDRA